ncbi:MAG: glycosyltransferase [Alphaproteobacteria bacterium]|nr:glycosyltransferase [Alphaproteobacteria bacterium]
MKKVAILYIALGRYIVFWKDFFESCQANLSPCEKHYFIWTDNTDFDYSDIPNVTVIPAQKRGWPYDTLLRFEMFLGMEKELKKFDYIYFFNANFQFVAPVDLAEITPREWHDGLVAGSHPGRRGDVLAGNPDLFGYERRPESTAYVPFGKGKDYVCGAFNGGTSAAFLTMCQVLAKNVQIDLKNGIVARVDDESHLNAYLIDKKYLLCGRAYGFPEGKLKHVNRVEMPMIKIISRHKESPKYGGVKWLRGQTDKKMPNNAFTRNIMRPLCHGVALFIPIKKYRSRVRGYFG